MDLALDPPVIESPDATGLILDVAAVGIVDPAGAGDPYIRGTDGTIYRVPESLRDWAMTLVAMHQHHRKSGLASMFPCQIDFGILDGRMYAELL